MLLPDTSIKEKKQWLVLHGFIATARDERFNRSCPGKFMVCDEELLRLAHPTDNGGDGYCIVGDDLDSLIVEAFKFWTNGGRLEK